MGEGSESYYFYLTAVRPAVGEGGCRLSPLPTQLAFNISEHSEIESEKR